MKRFFTKKSVAYIFVTILLFGFFSFNITPARAATTNNSILTSSILNPYAALSSWIGGLLPSPTDFITGIGGSVATAISYIIQAVTIPLASIGLSIAGSILDFSVQYTIYGTGFSTMSSSIQGVWTLIRDTANICFIFILLYAAIQQIITGAAKKSVLVAVIISAVLINFSLFFTKIVIDAGNVVATAIYNQITVTAGPSSNIVQNTLTGLGTGLSGNTSQIDLSGRLMDGLGLKTMWDSLGGGSTTTGSSSVITGTQPSDIIGIAGLINSVLRVILIVIATFVFMALALLLIGRFVMLVILMATSPIGFLFEVIPGLGGTSKEWRNSLFNQVLIAPAIMFFMLLTIRLSQILTTNTTGGASVTSPLILFFNFFLIAFLLLKAVNITKKMSGPIASFTDKISSVATGLALGAATGGTALIARQTIGRGANMLANSQTGKRLEALSSKGGISGSLAKMTLGGIKGTAKSTFDVRGTEVAKGAIGAAAGISGMSVIDKKYAQASGMYGKGQTGYAGLVENKTQAALEEAKAADKSAAAYQQKVIDMNPKILENYKNKKQEEIDKAEQKIKENEAEIKELDKQKTNLNDQLKNEKDENKKNAIRDEIKAINDKKGAVQEEKTKITGGRDAAKKAKDESKASDVLESHKEDFSAAETKIDNYRKEQKDLIEKNKALEEKSKTASAVEELEIDKERSKLRKEIDRLGADIERINEVKKDNLISEIDTIKMLKEARKNMAENYRSTFKANTLLRGENREIAAKIERDTKEKEVKTEDVLKELKKMQEKQEEKK